MSTDDIEDRNGSLPRMILDVEEVQTNCYAWLVALGNNCWTRCLWNNLCFALITAKLLCHPLDYFLSSSSCPQKLDKTPQLWETEVVERLQLYRLSAADLTSDSAGSHDAKLPQCLPPQLLLLLWLLGFYTSAGCCCFHRKCCFRPLTMALHSGGGYTPAFAARPPVKASCG